MPARPPPSIPPELLPATHPHKGRGAASNPEGRFESTRHQAEDDGWQSALLDEQAPLDSSPERAAVCGPVIELEAMIRAIEPQILAWTIDA